MLIEKQELENICKLSKSYNEVARYFGVNKHTAKSYILKYEINIEHFAFKLEKEKLSHECCFCKEQTLNPKFCSRSCAASYNNSIKPKIIRTKTCADCGIFILRDKRKFCDDCRIKRIKYKDTTPISQIPHSGYGHRQNIINALARAKILKMGMLRQCSICQYNKHVEVCHIKAISDFSQTATIGEVNDIKNLVVLCPNCHWELDHNLISNISDYQ